MMANGSGDVCRRRNKTAAVMLGAHLLEALPGLLQTVEKDKAAAVSGLRSPAAGLLDVHKHGQRLFKFPETASQRSRDGVWYFFDLPSFPLTCSPSGVTLLNSWTLVPQKQIWPGLKTNQEAEQSVPFIGGLEGWGGGKGNLHVRRGRMRVTRLAGWLLELLQ